MSLFRRFALVLALGMLALHVLEAQSSSSNPAAEPQNRAQADQNQGQLSVQARIKARREQRRAQAIHDTYGRLYEAFVGSGYLRFTPGSTLQRVNEYPWVFGVTRNHSQRLGISVEGRGYYGSPFIEPKPDNQNITQPTITEYAVLAGPSYRFYLQPRYSISGRVMAGYSYGHFSGETGGNQTLSTYLGLYPDGSSFAASVAVIGEYNLTPAVAIRVAPEYYPTRFGARFQNSLGFTSGLVLRFGKQ